MNSPVHRDPITGLPNISPVPDGVDFEHSVTPWDGGERIEDITDALFNTMTFALNGAYKKVVQGLGPECPYS